MKFVVQIWVTWGIKLLQKIDISIATNIVVRCDTANAVRGRMKQEWSNLVSPGCTVSHDYLDPTTPLVGVL